MGPLSPPMVAMPLLDVTSPTLPEPSTSPRGRLRPRPTMAMVDMEDTDTAMEDMVAMEAMVDTDTTTARGRLRLMPTMAATMAAMAMVDMVDMVDTDTMVRGRLTCWPRFKMTFCLKHTAAEYLVQNMNLNQLPSTVEASPYPTMDMVRSTDMEL